MSFSFTRKEFSIKKSNVSNEHMDHSMVLTVHPGELLMNVTSSVLSKFVKFRNSKIEPVDVLKYKRRICVRSCPK